MGGFYIFIKEMSKMNNALTIFSYVSAVLAGAFAIAGVAVLTGGRANGNA